MGRSTDRKQQRRRTVRGWRGPLLLGVALAAVVPGRAAETPAACRLTGFATGRAQMVIDGRTFVLDDGREVRISGIETPSPVPGDETAAAAARAALQQAIGENEIVLKRLEQDRGAASDRYGRLIAHAYVRTTAGENSLARELLGRGQAMVAARKGEGACTRDLVAAERVARAAKLGLWGDPRYDLKRAENPAEVLAVRGRFTLVEGTVLSVRESGGTIYINFGRRWTEDFTVTIAKRNERAFASAGLAPPRLQGRRVQVRGVVEERGGPWIEAERPEQIEIVGGH